MTYNKVNKGFDHKLGSTLSHCDIHMIIDKCNSRREFKQFIGICILIVMFLVVIYINITS